jgi:L-asparaginase / beta-aspartyl-peptidase
MKKIVVLTVMILAILSCDKKNNSMKDKNEEFGPITIVIHGGAGTIKKENMSPEKEKAYHDALNLALDSGYKVLEGGGTSLDAVIAAIKTMEDSPL